MIHGEKIAGSRYIIQNIMKNARPCPYWIAHSIVQNRLFGDLLFEKWCKRPSKSYNLYWKLHSEEYKNTLNIDKNKVT